MARTYGGKWEGGFIREEAFDNGKVIKTFYIRRTVGQGDRSKRVTISTQAHTIQGALVALARFEADPSAFVALDMGTEPLYLNGELVRAYLEWCRTKPNRNGTSGNSDEWRKRQGSTLEWWAEKLQAQNLRKLEPTTIRAHATYLHRNAKKPTEDKNRLTVLLGFYTWLRKERNLIRPDEDPFLGRISIPKSQRANNIKSKIFSMEDWNQNHDWLIAHPQDTARGPTKKTWTRIITATMMEVLLATGWHVRETLRMVLEGDIEKIGEKYKIRTPKAKKGTEHSCWISEAGYEAALRLRELLAPRAAEGMPTRIMENHIHEDLRGASEATGIEMKTGWHRHTVVTHAREAGDSDAQIAAQVGNSEKMIRMTYGDRATPPKITTLL